MNTALLQLLTQGVTLITPTGRLSSYLQHQFVALQIHTGKKSWETPDILPWHSWLKRTWAKLALDQNPEKVLLAPHQQLYLWQGIIGRSAWAGQLLQENTTARQAVRSWSLCQQWQIPVFPEGIFLKEDAFAFQQWAGKYQQHCEKNGWIDEAMLADVLSQHAQPINREEKIAFTGFDEFTPQQLALITKLRDSGCVAEELPLEYRNKQTIAKGYTDISAEIRAAACRARCLLESDASARIGIIVPDLKSVRARIENIFDDVFLPGAILIHAEPESRPYAISVGQPLTDYPVIAAALQILGLGSQPAVLEDFSWLLRSPYIQDHETESQQRARLDAALHKYGEYRVTSGSLHWMQKSGRIRANDMPENFINCYERYQQEFQAAAKKQPASEWAKLFTKLLKTFNWPGARALNSAEYQTVTEWQNQLVNFAALDAVSPTMSYREALMQLRQLILNTGFQPETPEAPVQILGMTGAAGMQFDHLWIMGLHAEAWPPKADPDPFIPLKLQRERGIPEATAGTRLQQSENLFRRLIHSSPDVILSYPRNERDRLLRPSPLIKNYPEATEVQLPDAAQDYAALLYHAGEHEFIDDTRAPAIATGKTVTGGTGLFKDQASCPFRACAKHRLHAEGLESKDIGLNAMDRGSIMHAVMEKFWKRLGSHAILLAMAEADLNQIISSAVASIINEYRKQFPLTFTERFTQLESERLQVAVRQLLEIERQRAPFTVQACEYWHDFSLNDISFRTRIDRIDQLLDGRTVIMDYKTGDPKISQWFSDRPDEPQLPLYAITSKGEIAAIVFTKLKRGEVAYIGLAEDEDLLPDVKTVTNTKSVKDIPDWPALMTQWQVVLDRLAIDFKKGDALVDPKNSDSCKFCDLHALCRIYERDTRYGNE